MLRHLGETEAGVAVEEAVRTVIGQGEVVTADLGGSAGTRAYGSAVAEAVSASRAAA
jgi:isocitrate/isopropylmalate dehydrogenase